jgi:NADPH:quinone reductase
VPTARIIRIHQHGGPEVLQFENVEIGPPGSGQVTIRVRAIGLNRSEVMFRNGRHIEKAVFPARLGYEASGTIEAVGTDVTNLVPGDAVAMVPPQSVTRWGTYGELVTVPAQFVVRNPPGVSWVDAAALWMQNVTAYGMLVDIARVASGDAVLILAASSSVGLAAIQLVREAGATAIATTRGRGKVQALLDHGAHHVIATDEEDLVARVRLITGGAGARIALDPVAGPGMAAVLAAMRPHGTAVVYGRLDSAETPLPVGPLIAGFLTLRGFTIKELVADPARLEAAKHYVLDRVAIGAIRPVIARTFPFDEMADAHRFLEANRHVGKVVVTL